MNNFLYRTYKRKSFMFKMIIKLTGYCGLKVIPEKNKNDT